MPAGRSAITRSTKMAEPPCRADAPGRSAIMQSIEMERLPPEVEMSIQRRGSRQLAEPPVGVPPYAGYAGYAGSEIETLGYPQAALFAFCLALVAFNLYAVVMAALRTAHPTQMIDESVFGVLPGRRDRHHHDRSEHRRPRARMGLACTGWGGAVRRLAARPRQPRGSAQAPQNDTWPEETSNPTNPIHKVNPMSQPLSCSPNPSRRPLDTLKRLPSASWTVSMREPAESRL